MDSAQIRHAFCPTWLKMLSAPDEQLALGRQSPVTPAVVPPVTAR